MKSESLNQHKLHHMLCPAVEWGKPDQAPKAGVSVEVAAQGLTDAALVDVLGVERERHRRRGVLCRLLVVALAQDNSRHLCILALCNHILPVPAKQSISKCKGKPRQRVVAEFMVHFIRR